MKNSDIKFGLTIWLIPEVKGSWFVLSGDLESNCRKSAQWGYDGVELMVSSADTIDRSELQRGNVIVEVLEMVFHYLNGF